MKGTIIGDIVGSIYEHHNIRTKDFPLFSAVHPCRFTDDTVMTLAVARAMMESLEDDEPLYDALVRNMQRFGKAYPHRGYGGRFKQWIREEDPRPYYSYGNGAAMRCSPAGWVCSDPEKARALAWETTLPTHNHPESVKAASLVAELICRARQGASMEALRQITLGYYDIPDIDKLREWNYFDVSCQGTMPAALSAFFHSTGFEDCIRNAISVGGDSDTIAAIAGSIAEAYYGVPEAIWAEAETYLDDNMRRLVHDFYDFARGLNEAPRAKNGTPGGK